MREHWTAENLHYGYFAADGMLRLRTGGTMVGFEISGPGHESASAHDVRAACERFTSSLAHFGTGDLLHLIVHRVAAPEYPERQFPNRAAYLVDRERARQFADERYYRNLARFYVANQDESAVANQLKALFFASTEHQNRGSRELQMERFFHRVDKWHDVMASTLHPRRMGSRAMFRDIILAVNGTNYDAPLPPHGTPLHHVIGQQDFVGGSTPKIGQNYVRPVTLVYPWPARTTEQALGVLLTHPGELMLSCRWVALDQADAEHVLKLERKRFVREANGTGIKQWMINAFNLKQRPTADHDTEEMIAECDGALSQLAKGMPYGWATITALVRGPDADEVNSRGRQMFKDLADIGHGSRLEDAAAVEAIKGAWPGQGTANPRRPVLSGANYCEIAIPVSRWEGTPEIDSSFFPKGTDAPLIVSGTGAEPFFVPSHIRSVGHTLVIGPTTAGKSVLLAAIIVALVVLPNARIVWLDRDFSSFVLTHALGGTYIELAADNSSPLCPFQWLDVENGTAWLFDWFVRLFKRWALDLNAEQAADLRTALALAKFQQLRRLGVFMRLLQDSQLRGILANYATGGQWGHVFDGEPTPIARHMLTTYEMRHLDALGERVSGPAEELIVHDAEVGLGADPTFVVIDEARWMLGSAVSLPFIDRALRTFRKYNGAIILATQSLAEIESSEVRSLLLESTAIKTFLPNHAAAGERVHALYAQLGLGEKEISIIAAAIPQCDYLCTTEYGARLFRLDLGALAGALCASTGANDVAKARALLAEYGREGFLDAWLHAKGLGPVPQVPAAPSLIIADISHTNGRLVHAAN
jgi:type IV secretion system protein VirB4